MIPQVPDRSVLPHADFPAGESEENFSKTIEIEGDLDE